MIRNLYIFLFAFLLIGLFGSGKANSQLSLARGDTTVVKSVGDWPIYSHYILENSSDETIEVVVTLKSEGLAEDEAVSICTTEQCLSVQTNPFTSNPFPVEPGQTDPNATHMELLVTESGEKSVHAKFHIDGKPDEFVEYTAVFLIDVQSVNEKYISGIYKIGDAYPNPSSGLVNVPVEIPLTNPAELILEIYDQTGRIVKEFPVDPATDRISFTVNDIAHGSYYYSLNIEGYRTAAKNLVISR